MAVDPEDVAYLRAKWDQAEALTSEVEANGNPCPNSRFLLDALKQVLDETAAEEA